MADRWNVHDHKDELRVSNFCTIYHLEQGHLCESEIHYDVILYHPIKWESRDKAYNWIKNGTIAEIQESKLNLGVCFTKKSFSNKRK